MLKVKAVLPRVGASGVLVVPVDSLAEVGQRSERGTCRCKNAAVERIRERVERSEEVVLRGDECRLPAESILTAFFITGLREAADASPYHSVRTDPICEPRARAPFTTVRIC